MYIDYSITTFIIQQIKLFTFFVNKLNLRLMRASIYLFQFTFDIRHKFDAHHIVSNALFKLLIDDNKSFLNSMLNDVYSLKFVSSQYVDEHNSIYSNLVVSNIHVQISSNFKNATIKEYQKNKVWRQIFDLVIIKRRTILVKKRKFENFNQTKWISIERSHESNIDFVFKNDFIYRIKNKRERFCLSISLKSNVFVIVHDQTSHVEFHRCHQRIFETLYFHQFVKRLRLYIRKCHACQLNQIRRHLLYDELMSIITFNISFHIITMNFILNLFICRDMNCFLILICKAFKSNKLLLDKNTYFVVD